MQSDNREDYNLLSNGTADTAHDDISDDFDEEGAVVAYISELSNNGQLSRVTLTAEHLCTFDVYVGSTPSLQDLLDGELELDDLGSVEASYLTDSDITVGSFDEPVVEISPGQGVAIVATTDADDDSDIDSVQAAGTATVHEMKTG